MDLSILGGPQAWLVANGTKLGLILALLVAVWVHGCVHGEKGAQKEIGHLESDLKTCGANSKGLETAIGKQNASITSTAAEGAKRVETSQAATVKAQPTIDRLSAEKAKADAYQRPAGVDACQAAKSIIEADNAEK